MIPQALSQRTRRRKLKRSNSYTGSSIQAIKSTSLIWQRCFPFGGNRAQHGGHPPTASLCTSRSPAGHFSASPELRFEVRTRGIPPATLSVTHIVLRYLRRTQCRGDETAYPAGEPPSTAAEPVGIWSPLGAGRIGSVHECDNGHKFEGAAAE
jgi:hypothetical protein